MNCPFCGAEQNKETGFCTECGKYLGPDTTAVVPSVDSGIKPAPKSEWATIGTWGWIGIILLLQIPVVNFILLIVWSFGGAKKNVKKSFARAMLIIGLVSAIISIASIIYLMATGKVVGVSSILRRFI